MYKAKNDTILCPSCGKYGIIKIFKSKMNGELIYRCDECFGIYESLCELEYKIETQVNSGYAKMIGIEDFKTDAINIGTLSAKDLQNYNVTFEEHPKEGVDMYGKGYLDGKVIFGEFHSSPNL
ncbi:hypothetical protein I6N96_15210 [Enterococcus sp. BWM-S5]|uniref:Transcription factor zinc-finger domain-containing protein n=1 Tax=Enterococcus larvae TaxID=2794352 RepID=A0ABS4CNL4_9ENTE|nr:hypothetical protein [Enterococcus larvae]MBP1047635.1 hypothetical protein [Enterococcus larvae]